MSEKKKVEREVSLPVHTVKSDKAMVIFHGRRPRDVPTASGTPEKARVDPTYAKDSQIQNMLAKFARGEIHPRQPMYADVSEFGDFRQLQERTIYLRGEFDKLPSAVRALAQNDPSNLPAILTDPRNKEFLTEHGVFKQVPLKESGGSEGTPDAGSGVQPQEGAQAPSKEPSGDKTRSVDNKK